MTLGKLAQIAFVGVLAAAIPAAYGAPEELLGTAHLDGRVDHDVIHVGIKDGRFHRVQLRVEKGPIEVIRLVVHYGDGEPEELFVRSRIAAGSKTRWIGLRGFERYINSVEIWYAKGAWLERRPEVLLFGER